MLEQARRAVDKANRGMQLLPFKKSQADANLLQAQSDIEKLVIIAAHSKRIIEEKQTSSSDKIYSIADIDAAIIRKGEAGGRARLQARSQLAFTGKGLVGAILVLPATRLTTSIAAIADGRRGQHRQTTQSVTVDDGYTCAAVRGDYLKRGVCFPVTPGPMANR
ncbi:MAG: hypothetical protein R3F19_03515 [Verrucomicrobiales bacterium]